MEFLREIFDPGFLLRNTVYTSLLVGFTCPLVGVYLVLRRLVFLGVALPQISSTGVALALSLHVWYGDTHFFHETGEHNLAIIGAVTFSLLAIIVLSQLERRGRAVVESRLGTAYVIAGAASILLISKCPTAEGEWLALFKGEIIAVSNTDLVLTAAIFAVVLAGLGLFRKEFLLVSFDREMAVTLKKAVRVWDLGLYLLIALAIAAAVLTVGPLVTFGFLVIPPLTARTFARNMRQFAFGASCIGGVAALVGFMLAYKFDAPVGPTEVAVLGVIYLVVFAGRKIQIFFTRRNAS